MLIALISDIHDNVNHLLEALHVADRSGCRHLLCMGDLCELSTLHLLRDNWAHPIEIGFGNNEYDRASHRSLAAGMRNITHHGDRADITLDGRRIHLSHHMEDAARAVDSGLYDAVFFGHTHVQENLRIGKTLVANPGEICGNRQPAGFAIYDTATNDVTMRRL